MERRDFLKMAGVGALALSAFAAGSDVKLNKNGNNTSNPLAGFRIGSSQVTAAGTADYTCDGVNDDVQVQAALAALPLVGGRVEILSGNFVFGATIGRAVNNVTIEGLGNSTYIAWNAASPLISLGATSGWVIKNMRLDAGGINFGTATNYIFDNVWIGTVYYPANPRTSAKIVAASNSSIQDKSGADYVCDGTADDVEINAAIVAVNAIGGGKVSLQSGTFTVASRIIPKSNVHLALSAGTIITIPDSVGAGYSIIQYSIIAGDAFSLDNFTLEGGTINGNKAGQSVPVLAGQNPVPVSPADINLMDGVHIANAVGSGYTLTNCHIRNVNVINVVATPINFGKRNGSDPTTILNWNNSIENCRVSTQYMPASPTTWHDAIYIGAGGTNALYNWVRDAGDDGIAQEYGDGFIIAFNDISGSYNNGIAVNGTGQMIGNTVALSGAGGGSGYGIYVEKGGGGGGVAPQYGQVDNNIIYSNAWHGIFLEKANYYNVGRNQIYLNGGNGILVFDTCSHNNISENILYANSQASNTGSDNIQIQTSVSYCKISGNICREGALSNKPRYAIFIVNNTCSYNMVHGNDLYDGGATGDLADGGTSTKLRDNMGKTGSWLGDV